MSCWLKQSTAVDVKVGPFLDDTDGKTAETGLTITQPDIQLAKNGGAFAQKNAAQTLSHESNGWYEVALDTTDTNTLGILILQIHESGALPVWREFMVVAANIYDSIIGGGDLLQVDVQELEGDSQSSIDLKDFADAGYDPATNKVEGVKLADTLTTYTGNTVQTGDAYARLGAPAGASVSADVAAVKSQTGAIETDTQDLQSRTPAALVSGRMDSSVGAMAANTMTAAAAAPDLTTELQANLALEASVQSVKSKTDNLPTDPADQSLIIAATDAVMARLGAPAGASISADIAAIEAQTDDIGAAGAGLTAVPWNPAWTQEAEDAIWDALIAGHADVGSTGEQLAAAGAAGDPWATALPGAYGAGSAGKIVGDNLNAPVATVDTVVDAIKAKTDSLSFTVPGNVDSNVQRINDVAITGDGQAGTEFGV